MSRSSSLRVLSIGLLAGLLSPAASAQTPLEAQLVVSGLSSPLLVTAPEGDTERLFVVQQSGAIRIVRNGVVNATPFLNLAGQISSGGERGLLGLAFHSDFANNGRFFVNFTTPSGATNVAEYNVTGSPMTNDVADPTQVGILFSHNQPFSNHNGGCIAIGGDGKLYIGTGDGGSGNDPGNRAQNPTNNLGKMLRLDVDIPFPHIPTDNPFVGVSGTNDKIWALGLRNPWRFSFDRLTGDLWVGDVGQNAREEINFEAAGDGGRNYGWRCMEGFNCTGLSGCNCNDIALTLPIRDYGHSGGNCSVTGGYVYRGNAIPDLQGTYFYADYCSSQIWSLRYDGSTVTDFQSRTTELEPAGTPTINNIPSFGEDGVGELYICDFGGGEIYKIVPQGGSVENYCGTSPNSAGPGATMASSGSTSISANTFTIEANDAISGQFGVFFYGFATSATPYGDGTLCINPGGGLFRLNPPVQVSGGSASRLVDFTSPPANQGAGAITSGDSVKFQFWFRDPNGPGGSGFNFSDGLNAVFTP